MFSIEIKRVEIQNMRFFFLSVYITVRKNEGHLSVFMPKI